MADQQQRRRVLFEGNVQGVGFRFTTRAVARRFAVVGFVRNLADGRVELVAEGEAKEIDAFVDAVGEAMGDNIHSQVSETLAASGEFEDFSVRH